MFDKKVRQLARKQGLTASKSRSDGLWRSANQFNFLESSEVGLNDEEALKYLTQDDGGKPMDTEATKHICDKDCGNENVRYRYSGSHGQQPMLEPAKASAEEILDDRFQGIEDAWTNGALRKWLHEQHEEMKRDNQAIRASIGESLEIIEKEFKQFGKLTMDATLFERLELYDNLANVTISCRFDDLPKGGRLEVYGNGWTYGDWDKEEDVDYDDLINALKYALIEFIKNMNEFKDERFEPCPEISDERSG